MLFQHKAIFVPVICALVYSPHCAWRGFERLVSIRSPNSEPMEQRISYNGWGVLGGFLWGQHA